MCSVCGTNRNMTDKIVEALAAARQKSEELQKEKDEYNATCGPMDYDFDCCDFTYKNLEDAVWNALTWLGLIPKGEVK